MAEVKIKMRRRMTFVLLVALLGFFAVIVKLAGVQLIQGSELKLEAEEVRTRDLGVAASRGTIYDRNGNKLAVSITADKDGKLDLGLFAHIYFIDWDHVIARHRQVNVTIMGTTEDVNDRKWNDGQVIDTRRKFTEEEKAYDIHFDLQQQR